MFSGWFICGVPECDSPLPRAFHLGESHELLRCRSGRGRSPSSPSQKTARQSRPVPGAQTKEFCGMPTRPLRGAAHRHSQFTNIKPATSVFLTSISSARGIGAAESTLWLLLWNGWSQVVVAIICQSVPQRRLPASSCSIPSLSNTLRSSEHFCSAPYGGKGRSRLR